MIIKICHFPKRIADKNATISFTSSVMPLGLFSLADMLDRAGHAVEIIHNGVEEMDDPGFRIEKDTEKSGTDLFCAPLHWHTQAHEVLSSTKKVKESCPDTRILLGGLTASLFAREIMDEWPHVDYIISGDAELPLKLLVESEFGAPEPVPNLSWRLPDGAAAHNRLSYTASASDLDLYSHVRLDLMRNSAYYNGSYIINMVKEDIEDLRSSQKIWYLYAGRGCSVDCAFCGGGALAHLTHSRRRGPIFRPVRNVAGDAVYLYEKHGVFEFGACFNPPGMDRSYYPALFRAISDIPNVSFFFEYYDGEPDQEFIETFSNVFRNPESTLALSPTYFTDDTRRKYYPAGIPNDQLESFLKKIAPLEIRTIIYYAIMPQESISDILTGAVRAFETVSSYPNVSIRIMPIEIEPGSPWLLSPEKFDIQPTRRTLSSFFEHHARRSFINRGKDLGYIFPAFDSIVDHISSVVKHPRFKIMFP